MWGRCQVPDARPWVCGLYAIIDDGVVPAAAMPMAARALVDGGVRALQLRIKGHPAAAREEIQASVAASLAGAEVLLVVNDRIDLAQVLMQQAPPGVRVGVHLGQEDLRPDVARGILGAEAIIGWSTHTLAQVAAAEAEGADYLGYGPVFPTGSKARPDALVGIEGLRDAAAMAPVPVVAIGGMDGPRGVAAMVAGASAVAMIAALYRDLDLGTAAGAEGLVARARELCGCLNRAQAGHGPATKSGPSYGS